MKTTTQAKTLFGAGGLALAGFLLASVFAATAAPNSPPSITASQLSGDTLTIQVANFPGGPLSVRFNAAPVPATYNEPAQRITVALAPVPAPGTYRLEIAKKNDQTLATQDVTIGATGPQGPVGPAGATGPQGPVGPAGATGPSPKTSASWAQIQDHRILTILQGNIVLIAR